MAQPRDLLGRFQPSGRGRTRRAITRVKLIGAEIVYRESGGDWGTMAAAVSGARARALNLTVPFALFKEAWFAQNRMIFEAQGIPPWVALNPEYAATKERQFPGQKILRRTNRLYDSLTDDTNDTVYVVTPRTIRMGTAVPYSEAHQLGLGGMPVREHDILLDATFAFLVDMTAAYIQQPLSEVFGAPT